MTRLLQYRAARLTLFVVVLTVAPAFVSGTSTYINQVLHARELCEPAGHLDPVERRQAGLSAIGVVNTPDPFTTPEVRCEYTVLVPEALADRSTKEGDPLDKETAAEFTRLKTQLGDSGSIRLDGHKTISPIPAFTFPAQVAGVILGAYAALVGIVWSLIWVWRGSRPRKDMTT